MTRSTSIDSTYVKAQRAAFGGKGAYGASDWPVAWRLDHQIHALTDVVGRPYALTLSAGNVSDVTVAPALLERAGRMRYLLADKGYDADQLRRSLRAAGIIPVIPGRRNRKRPVRHDRHRYRGRQPIENAFCRLKNFCRIATRYDKLATNFLSAVALVTAVAFWL